MFLNIYYLILFISKVIKLVVWLDIDSSKQLNKPVQTTVVNMYIIICNTYIDDLAVVQSIALVFIMHMFHILGMFLL